MMNRMMQRERLSAVMPKIHPLIQMGVLTGYEASLISEAYAKGDSSLLAAFCNSNKFSETASVFVEQLKEMV